MKIITITERVRELVYDIQNKAFLAGRAREAEGKKGYEAASYMQTSDDEGECYQIKRSLTNAFTALKGMMGEYIAEENTTGDNLINKEIDCDGTLTLSLVMPRNYNGAATDGLCNGIHDYLVDMALADWFAITDKEDAEIYIANSAQALENVKRAFYKRCRPKRTIL